MAIQRRRFLIQGMRLVGASLLPKIGALADVHRLQYSLQNGRSTDAEELIWYSTRYLTAEMPMDRLSSWITPTANFFVRNNLLMPEIGLDRWRLKITGEVVKPLELSFAQFRQLPAVTVTNTLECAGNGRAFFQPHIGGVPWQRGGVGNAIFSGPRLRDLLEKSGLKPSGRHVAFKGLDVVPPGAQEFVRSIPISKALEPTTLLASHMNGAELTPPHGFPARAVVPGWIGSCSIKRLCEIQVLKEEFDGFYMNSAYRLPRRSGSDGKSNPDRTEAITSLIVKSIIAYPQDGTTLALSAAGVVSISGAAWAGERAIEKVEISTDGGRTWHNASLGPDHAKYAWRLWKYEWRPPRAGSYVLQSRATDEAGDVQPQRAPWNPSGYLWNGIDQIRVTVRSA